MIKQLPDKWVRKAIYDAINNLIVLNELTNETIQIPCYDSRVTANGSKNYYILMSTQTSQVSKTNKCEDMYESSILLDIVTIYNGAGNVGSRVLADNILDKVRELTNDLTLDVSSNLTVLRQTQEFPNDIVSITKNQNVFRKLMRLELTIN